MLISCSLLHEQPADPCHNLISVAFQNDCATCVQMLSRQASALQHSADTMGQSTAAIQSLEAQLHAQEQCLQHARSEAAEMYRRSCAAVAPDRQQLKSWEADLKATSDHLLSEASRLQQELQGMYPSSGHPLILTLASCWVAHG